MSIKEHSKIFAQKSQNFTQNLYQKQNAVILSVSNY